MPPSEGSGQRTRRRSSSNAEEVVVASLKAVEGAERGADLIPMVSGVDSVVFVFDAKAGQDACISPSLLEQAIVPAMEAQKVMMTVTMTVVAMTCTGVPRLARALSQA